MSITKALLVKKALEAYRIITPCNGDPSFTDGFTQDAGYEIFWFNDLADSTHIVKVGEVGNEID